MIPGTPDFVLLWASGAGVVEMKADDGRLSPYQRHFQQWCQDTGVRWAVARSLEEVEAALAAWIIL